MLTLDVSLPGSPSIRVRVFVDDPLVQAAVVPLLQEAGARVERVAESGRPERGTPDGLVALIVGALPNLDLEEPALALVADADQARTAWAAGVRGLLPRDIDGAVLLRALAAVAEDLIVVDPAFADALLPHLDRTPVEAEALTPREREVLVLLAEGLPNKLVADRLDISERTARYHVAQILAKLGVQSRTEAVVQAARLGLIAL